MPTQPPLPIVIIGGGAAGFFGAIRIKALLPQATVIILEKNQQLLTKVRISGGGRCNVTHACFTASELVQNYPRGGKELRSAFNRFSPKETMDWFQSRNIPLKIEEDGRIFPVSDSSQSIIDCFLKEASNLGVEIRTGCTVSGVERIQESENFILHLTNQESIHCSRLLVASGSNHQVYDWLALLGHTIMPPIPSLFTFNVPTSPLLDLSGVAIENAQLSIVGLKQTGPLLLTHFGFSGPAVLKLSAWGAEKLHHCHYKTVLEINWLPKLSYTALQKSLSDCRYTHAQKLMTNHCPFSLSKNLWKKFLLLSGIDQEMRFSALSNKQIEALVQKLHANTYQIDGKTTYKQEFVTCGGVHLPEVNFKTMESRLIPGLHFAGEVLNIDGITGGFNFQNAWTTSWIAAEAISESCR